MADVPNLLDLRQGKKLTQKQVSADLNISVSTINRHERGKTTLRGRDRLAYANYYGVKPETIEQPAPPQPKKPTKAKAKRRPKSSSTERKAA